METRIIEVKSAEGGSDSQMFVSDLIAAYTRLSNRKGWKARVVRERPSDAGHFEIALEIKGHSLENLDQEAGGHRLQRVPPSEKRGRVHTSTVVVAVLDPSVVVDDRYFMRSDDDFRIEFFSGTGKGGQHRNKHECSCRMIHIPTGIMETRQGRSREANVKDAKAAIHKTLDDMANAEKSGQLAVSRKEQCGSGQRGDKTVTIAFQRNMATSHTSGKTITAEQYMKGFMDSLWS